MAPNPWLAHVQKVRKANPKMAYRDVLVKAKSSYKKKAAPAATKKPVKKTVKKAPKGEEPME